MYTRAILSSCNLDPLPFFRYQFVIFAVNFITFLKAIQMYSKTCLCQIEIYLKVKKSDFFFGSKKYLKLSFDKVLYVQKKNNFKH